MNLPPQPSVNSTTLNAISSTFARVAKYTVVRAIVLFITVVIAVYLTILIANLGGYVDIVISSNIDKALGGAVMGGWLRDVPTEEKFQIIEQTKWQMEEAAGLHEPFMARCFRWLGRGLTLDWGESAVHSIAWTSETKEIRVIILDNLPRTLLLFGMANLFLFFTGVFLALPLTKKYGNWLDRLIITLSPMSSAPSWVYGIILNLIFMRVLSTLSSGGTFDAWPDEFKLAYLPMVLKHMILPFSAIFLSGLFQSVYAWRTFFLIYSSEDHVEMAKARGLPSRMIERRYILRPVLPNLITSFALLFISLWQEVIALEYFFNVAGIGRLFMNALKRFETPVIVGLVVTFAYLLAITVFLLDIVYALVDPRVRVGGGSRTVRAAARKRWSPRKLLSVWNRLRRSGSPLGAPHPTRGRASGKRPQDFGWRVPRAVMGSQVLEQVLGSFLAVEGARADWLVEPGTGRKLVVDRLYPELGMAIRFTSSRDSAEAVYAKLCRQAGIALVELDPHGPVSPRTMREIGFALSAASRRVAQRQGAREVKLALLPRIASAKAACRQLLDPSPSRQTGRWHEWERDLGQTRVLANRLSNLKSTLRELSRYPSAIVGLVIIVALIGVSIYAVIAMPYDEVISRWRGEENAWYRNPKKALPEWVNLFRKDDLPSTIILNSRDSAPSKVGVASKSATFVAEGMTEITLSFAFDFPYGAFPQDLTVSFEAQYDEKKPLLSLFWLTPDGREIEMGSFSIVSSHTYHLSKDNRLQRKLDAEHLEQAFFADPKAETLVPLKGTYELRVSGIVFEEDADLDAEFVLYGQVYGLAGTDHNRRDLMVALLWGAPVALAFGLLAAVGTSVSTMVIAAVGVWFGGWVDGLIQRITEVNMILPFFPISLMIYTLYSKSFWVILGVTVLLSIFGSAIKNYRAIFLQMKEAPHIEAARAYGASNWRIISRYLIPRITAVLVPQLVILVPSYVFLEATLAFLGVSDPVLPTWGKLIVEGISYGVYSGTYHIVLEPVGLLMLVGLAFVMVGLALERIFEPRLRDM
jgi:peptide/nickel transport system permease protein